MSVNGLRIGGQYVSNKPVPLWVACAGWAVFVLAVAGFVIGGWACILVRSVSYKPR